MTFLTINTKYGPVRLRSIFKGTAIADDLPVLKDVLPVLGNDFFGTPDVLPKPVYQVSNPTGGRITSWRNPRGALSALKVDDTSVCVSMGTKNPVTTFVSRYPNVGFVLVDKYDADSVLGSVERRMLAYQVRNTVYASKTFGDTHEDRKVAFEKGRHAEAMAARLVTFAVDHALANFTGSLRPTNCDACYLYMRQGEGRVAAQPFSVFNQGQLAPFCQADAVNRANYDAPCVLMVGPGSLARGCALLASLGRSGGPVRGQRSDLMRQFDKPMSVLLVGTNPRTSNWPNVQGKDIWRAIHEAAFILNKYNNVDVDKMNAWMVATIDNLPIIDTTLLREAPGDNKLGWDATASGGFGAPAELDVTNDPTAATRIDGRIATFVNGLESFNGINAVRRRAVLGGFFDDDRDNVPQNTLDGMREAVYDSTFAQSIARFLSAGSNGVAHNSLPNGDPVNNVDPNHGADPNRYFEYVPQNVSPADYVAHPRWPVPWKDLQPWACAVLAGRDTFRIVGSMNTPANGWASADAPLGVVEFVGPIPNDWPALASGRSWVVVMAQVLPEMWAAISDIRVMVQTWIGSEHAPVLSAPPSDAIPARWPGSRVPRLVDPIADRNAHTELLVNAYPELYRAVNAAADPGGARYFQNPNVTADGLQVNHVNHRIGIFLHGACTMWDAMNGNGRVAAARAAYVHALGKPIAPYCPDEFMIHLGGQLGLCDVNESGGLWVLSVAPAIQANVPVYVYSQSFLNWLEDDELFAAAVVHRRACKEMAYAYAGAGPATLEGNVPSIGELPTDLSRLWYEGALKTRTSEPHVAATLINGIANNLFPDALGVMLQRVHVTYTNRMRVCDVRADFGEQIRWYAAYMRPVVIPRTYIGRVMGIHTPTRIADKNVKLWMKQASWATGFFHVDGTIMPASGEGICDHDEAMLTWMEDEPGNAKEVVGWSPRGMLGSYTMDLHPTFLNIWDRRIEHQEHRVVFPYEHQIAAVLSGDSATIRNYRNLKNMDAVGAKADISHLHILDEGDPLYNYVRTPDAWSVNVPNLYGGPASGNNVYRASAQTFAYGAKKIVAPVKCFSLCRAAIEGMKMVAERGAVKFSGLDEIIKQKDSDMQSNAGYTASMTTMSDMMSMTQTSSTNLTGHIGEHSAPSATILKDGNTMSKSVAGGGTAPAGDARVAPDPDKMSSDSLAKLVALMSALTDTDRAALLAQLGTSKGNQNDNRGGTTGANASATADF